MLAMTPRERLDRCYRRRETDRPGIFLRGVSATAPRDPSYAPLRELGVKYAGQKGGWSPWSLVEAHPTTVTTEPHSDDWDMQLTVLHTPAGDLRTRSFVGRHGQPGLTQEYFLKTVEDAEKYLSVPLPEPRGELDAFFCAVEEMGRKGIVEIGLGFNPAGHVAELFGTETFALMSVEHRDVVHALLRYRLEGVMRVLDYALAHGGGPYFAMLGEEYVLPPIHGPRDFNDFNVRYDKPTAERIHEADGLLHIHSHGSLKAVMDGFLEVAPDVLHPMEPPPGGDMTAADTARIIGGRICVEGNVQIGDMHQADADAIRRQVRELIEEVWLPQRRGLIVCPTASPYFPQMEPRTLENYRALVETVLEYGQ